MIGSRRNRGEHGSRDCRYGCCRGLVTGDKAKTRRILKRREERAWKRGETTEP